MDNLIDMLLGVFCFLGSLCATLVLKIAQRTSSKHKANGSNDSIDEASQEASRH